MPELFLEIGCEEIPANSIPGALQALEQGLRRELQEQRLDFESLNTCATARRLACQVQGLASMQRDLVETLTGPPRSVAYDGQGRPTVAAKGFAKKNKIPVGRLLIVSTAKGEYAGFERRLKGQPAARVLAARLPGLIASLPFPKTMYWTQEKFRFSRPIRWIVALLDQKVVGFEVAGIQSGRFTAGHRFLGSKQIKVESFARYREALRENFVLVIPEERRQKILRELQERAAEVGGPGSHVRSDADLLTEVTYLNEYPTVMSGQFAEEFLRLPPEVLVTVMRENQKYFSVLDPQGNLLPYFLAVINLDSDRNGSIRKGHERVLRARLEDAKFYWEADRRTKLMDRLQRLEHVLFQEKLGSYYEKTDRVRQLALNLVAALKKDELAEAVATAARLAKTDLTTAMVKEFTNLQGIVGGLYAREEGYPESVWKAVYDQYLPLSADGTSPETVTGALLSIADKMDTVAGCFGIGLIPSGSKDPFGLRRLGQGIIKICFDHRLNLSLAALSETSLRLLAVRRSRDETEARADLLGFLERRLRFLLQERGFQYDVINAVLASGSDDPYDALKRAEAVAAIRPEEEFEAISVAFKRVKNILTGQDEAREGESLQAGLLKEPTERALYDLFSEIRPRVDEEIGQLRYYEALKRIASMRRIVDKFFDDVLVMAPEADLRKNRLILLRKISGMYMRIADLSEIVVEG